MPIISVQMFEGRDSVKKQNLVRELTDAYVRSCGGEKESVTVILNDVSKNDWAKGGKLFNEEKM